MTATKQGLDRLRIGRRALVGGTIGAALSLPVANAIAGGVPARTSSLAQPQDSTPAVGSGGTLVVDININPENLDIHQGLTAATNVITSQIFEGLLRYTPGTVEIEPWLAESWESSEDGMEWIFNLRQGVTFHDGTPFNADAVKFNFDRQFDTTNEYYAMGQWTGVYDYDFLASCEVIGEYQVKFTQKTAFNKTLSRLGNFNIVSPTGVQTHREAFTEHPIGTGPYAFDRWDKGQQVVLKRFDDWWYKTPALDQLVFKAVIEMGARTAALLSGEVQFTVQISPEIIEQLEGNDDFQIVMAPTGSVWFLAMNMEFEKFSDIRVRQALNYAVDKETIVSAVLGDTVDIAHGPLAPAYADYNPAVESYFTYDPEKAKALLAEAGYVDDAEIVFYVPIGDPSMLSAEEMGTVIQDNLREVGISTKIESLEAVTWMDQIRSPANELTEMSWNLSPLEPAYVFDGLFTKASLPPGFNTSYYVNDEMETLMATAKTSLDPEEVHQAYMRMQEIVMEDVPIVPVCHRRQLFGMSSTVKGFTAQPSGAYLFYDVWVEN
jgi:peptide/nickel transport system substrate-binding protein